MKCTKCGHVFAEGLFCPECGAKYDENEAKELEAKEEIRREEEKEKQKVELANAKVEQERLAKEKMKYEAELMRQKNENMRIEQEAAAQREAAEKVKQEELTRTFNGILYDTVEEMQSAKAIFEEEEAEKKALKQADFYALLCMVLGIASYPLIMTYVGWLPAFVASSVFGVKAYKGKTQRRGMLITGAILDGIWIIGLIAGIIMMIVESMQQLKGA